MTFPPFLKKHGLSITIGIGVIAYIAVAGSTRSCAMCAAITDAVGLTNHDSDSKLDPSEAFAPQWSTTTLAETQISSGDLIGKIVVVDFWATWCPPCRKGIPDFIHLQEKYGSENLVVIGVSLDEAGPETVTAFAGEMGVNYPLAMAANGDFSDFGSIRSIPTTFIIDRAGNVVSRKVGFTRKATLESIIDPLL